MIEIKTALISVYDKTGLLELSQNLIKNNVLILSSGGTAKYLKNNGIEVTEVSEYTGFNEVFDGRVKTLHPKIHAGILARGDSDKQELEKLNAKKIDLVVVNLYPFASEVADENSTEISIIEKIDIEAGIYFLKKDKNMQVLIEKFGSPNFKIGQDYFQSLLH